jgi:hypothetical protein
MKKKIIKAPFNNIKILLDEGYQSLNLYYNLGNAYYKNNEIAKSILFFEKSA